MEYIGTNVETAESVDMPIAPDKWRCLGVVTIQNGVPVFPEDPENREGTAIPGVYRLIFDNEEMARATIAELKSWNLNAVTKS
jgi:hypothetical protein